MSSACHLSNMEFQYNSSLAITTFIDCNMFQEKIIQFKKQEKKRREHVEPDVIN